MMQPGGVVAVKAGTLDDRSDLRPMAEVWCVDRQPWVELPGIAISLDSESPSALDQAAAQAALRVDRGHGAERGHAHHGVHPRADRRASGAQGALRSEASRVGEEGVRQCRSVWTVVDYKKKT